MQHWLFGVTKPKGRYYYRFHKLIGKWNWRKYTERYLAPRSIENRQRMRYSLHANHGEMKHSKSWWWRLPKNIAAATTPDEVLEAWVTFRFKHPKKTFHYFKVLKRLIDVGGCDPTDWRLKLITSRLRVLHRKVLNLPRLAKYYAQLRDIDSLEHLTRFVPKMLHRYSPQQLVLTAHAFGIARQQDRRIFADIARLVEQRLDELSPSDLVRLAQAFARVELCHYGLLQRISAQLQVRVQQAAEGSSPPFTCPTMTHLAEVATAFATLKHQDFSYSEMCATQAEGLLAAGLPGPTPGNLARLCAALAKLKIHETTLFKAVVLHAGAHWYDYPASSLAEIGAAVSPLLAAEDPSIREAYSAMVTAIAADRDTLTLRDIGHAVKFMAELDRKDGEFAPGLSVALSKRLVEMRDDTKERYDVARAIEVFARRHPEDQRLFSCLSRHLHRHLGAFEPVDFLRSARGLSAVQYRDDRVAHALGKWAQKRAEEFSRPDWASFAAALAALKGGEEGASHSLLQGKLLTAA